MYISIILDVDSHYTNLKFNKAENRFILNATEDRLFDMISRSILTREDIMACDTIQIICKNRGGVLKDCGKLFSCIELIFEGTTLNKPNIELYIDELGVMIGKDTKHLVRIFDVYNNRITSLTIPFHECEISDKLIMSVRNLKNLENFFDMYNAFISDRETFVSSPIDMAILEGNSIDKLRAAALRLGRFDMNIADKLIGLIRNGVFRQLFVKTIGDDVQPIVDYLYREVSILAWRTPNITIQLLKIVGGPDRERLLPTNPSFSKLVEIACKMNIEIDNATLRARDNSIVPLYSSGLNLVFLSKDVHHSI